MKKRGYVYAFYDENNQPIYIGQTENVLVRYDTHKYEDSWMEEVDKILVHGPYDSTNVTNYYEEAYIRKERPKYNEMFTDGYNELPFTDNHEVKKFKSEEELVDCFKRKNDELIRSSYYLRKDQIEAIKLESFKSDLPKSTIIRNCIDKYFETINWFFK